MKSGTRRWSASTLQRCESRTARGRCRVWRKITSALSQGKVQTSSMRASGISWLLCARPSRSSTRFWLSGGRREYSWKLGRSLVYCRSGFGIRSNFETENTENEAKSSSYEQFCFSVFTECQSLQYHRRTPQVYALVIGTWNGDLKSRVGVNLL